MGRVLSTSFQLSGTLFFTLKVVGMLLAVLLAVYSLHAFKEKDRIRAELKHFRHVAMSPEKGRATLETALKLQRISGVEIYPVPHMGPESLARALKQSFAREEIAALLERKGFFNAEDWTRHWFSLIYAINYYSDEHRQDYEELLRRVQYYDMPERERAHILSLVHLLIPPRQNVKVVERLLVDERLRGPVIRLMEEYTEFREARLRLWMRMKERRMMYGP